IEVEEQVAVTRKHGAEQFRVPVVEFGARVTRAVIEEHEREGAAAKRSIEQGVQAELPAAYHDRFRRRRLSATSGPGGCQCQGRPEHSARQSEPLSSRASRTRGG